MEKQEEAKCIVNFTIHQTAFNYFQIDYNIAIRIHIKRYRITCIRLGSQYLQAERSILPAFIPL